MRSTHFGTALFFLLLLCASAQAAKASRAPLDSCIGLYEQGQYADAVDGLRAALPKLQGPEEAEAYKYLAFSYVMLDMIGTAKRNFKVLLEKYPQVSIDTVSVPPNITVVFNQARSEAGIAAAHTNAGEHGISKPQKPWYSKWYVWTPVAALGAGTGIYFAVSGDDGNNSPVPSNMRQVQIDGTVQ